MLTQNTVSERSTGHHWSLYYIYITFKILKVSCLDCVSIASRLRLAPETENLMGPPTLHSVHSVHSVHSEHHVVS